MSVDLENNRLMDIEWQDWRYLCKELESFGIDINKEDMLHARIIAWSKSLVKLRMYQKEHDIG